MRFVSKTDVGQKRTNNEDSIFAKIYNKDVALFIVADGLGGYESGEVASSILVDKISKYIEDNLKLVVNYSEQKIKNVIHVALILANNEIYRLEKTDDKYKGMGTTVVLLLKVKSKLFYVSIGDSRMYYITKNKSNITQVTVDDTYVNELIRTNLINEEEASTHPQKHILTKAVGILKGIEFDVNILDKKSGYVILCSDGITNMIVKEELLNSVKEFKFENLADELINLANKNGGVDNISAIVVEL